MKTFEELGVNAAVRRAIEELGFVSPMPVQEAVIPLLMKGQQDVIALAQTGTGKTAAFGIPLLQRIDALTDHLVDTLVLAQLLTAVVRDIVVLCILLEHVELRHDEG